MLSNGSWINPPRVLLHACCAPCSSAIVEWMLLHDIEPVIYFCNPNIFPFEEYEIRKNESKRHAQSLGVRWIDDDWNHSDWLSAVKGLEQEPERGKRCEACFYLRLFAAARKAQQLGIPFFATSLASSRWKNLDQVNAAGEKAAADNAAANANAAAQHPTFWPMNWRKDGLQERRNQLIKDFRFYNQRYCGCEFSFRTQNPKD